MASLTPVKGSEHREDETSSRLTSSSPSNMTPHNVKSHHGFTMPRWVYGESCQGSTRHRRRASSINASPCPIASAADWRSRKRRSRRISLIVVCHALDTCMSVCRLGSAHRLSLSPLDKRKDNSWREHGEIVGRRDGEGKMTYLNPSPISSTGRRDQLCKTKTLVCHSVLTAGSCSKHTAM